MKVKSQVSCPMDILTYISQCLKYILLAAAVYFITVYVVLAFLHIRFPFALEWIEGSVLDHVRRVFTGQKVYVSPSVEFVPAIYPPLYYYLSAFISQVIGFGFMPLRLVSFISSLGSFVLIFLIVRKETGSRFAGIAASCLFAATYRISGPYFDMGRVDSLFLFFFLAAVYVIKFTDSWKSYVFAGALVSFSALTKQTALVLSLPLILYSMFFRPRVFTAAFVITMAVVTGSASLFIDYVHNGWYSFYVFDLPRQHPVIMERLADFWTEDILLALPFACVLSALYIFAPHSIRSKKDLCFYLMLACSMIAVACMSRIKVGGFKNVLIPAYASLSILFGLGLGVAFKIAGRWQKQRQKIAEILIYLISAIQFMYLIYNPLYLIPDKRYVMSCQAVISTVAQMDGEVFAPAYGYLCVIAGKKGSAHIGATNDILRGNPGLVRDQLIDNIRGALQEKRFQAIILDREFEWLQKQLEGQYVLLPSFNSQNPARPLIKYCYVPKSK